MRKVICETFLNDDNDIYAQFNYQPSSVHRPRAAVREYGVSAYRVGEGWSTSGVLKGPIAFTIYRNGKPLWQMPDGRISDYLDGPLMVIPAASPEGYQFHSHPVHPFAGPELPPSDRDMWNYEQGNHLKDPPYIRNRQGDGVFDGQARQFYWLNANEPKGSKYTFEEARVIFGCKDFE